MQAAQVRPSSETDRRHLLAESVAPSSAASTISFALHADHDDRERDEDSHQPPRASSPARSTASTIRPETYRGFPSQAAYLAALNEWAEEKKWLKIDSQLPGFYGPTTMQEYASRPPGVQIGLRKRWKARKERKASMAAVSALGGDGVAAAEQGDAARPVNEQRRGTI